MRVSDLRLRRYMTLAEKAQAGTANPYELIALALIHAEMKVSRARWLREVAA